MSWTTAAIALKGLSMVAVGYFANRMKHHADECIKRQAEIIEGLLTQLCIKSEGDEREDYREKRKLVQSFLERL